MAHGYGPGSSGSSAAPGSDAEVESGEGGQDTGAEAAVTWLATLAREISGVLLLGE